MPSCVGWSVPTVHCRGVSTVRCHALPAITKIEATNRREPRITRIEVTRTDVVAACAMHTDQVRSRTRAERCGGRFAASASVGSFEVGNESRQQGFERALLLGVQGAHGSLLEVRPDPLDFRAQSLALLCEHDDDDPGVVF